VRGPRSPVSCGEDAIGSVPDLHPLEMAGLHRTRHWSRRLTASAALSLSGAAHHQRFPLRFAPGGTRELSSEPLVSPPLRYGENQEFEQMPLRGTAQLAR
jgi:hypothetical protein